ncbi:hypothetical protein ACW7G2_02030 [Luteimonas sp. A277]
MDARKRRDLRGDAAMRWGDYIKRTAVRRAVWIVVGVLIYALLGLLGQARAQSYAQCFADVDSAWCPNASDGVAAAQARAEVQAQQLRDNPWNTREVEVCAPSYSTYGSQWGQAQRVQVRIIRVGLSSETCANGATVAQRDWLVAQACPGGGEWREDMGRCFDPSECLERNKEPGYGVPTTRGWKSDCIAGCTLSFSASGQGYTCTTVGGSLLCAGSLEYSGEQCDVPPGTPPTEDTPPARDDKATCTPGSDGQSFCIKPNGEQCYTTANGQRQVCWTPTETGEKSDQNTLQKRNPGPTEIPPSNFNLPTGDTLEKVGQSIVAAIQKVTGNTTSTTTTTTTNYETQFGTNPGTGDQGEPSDGSGTPGGGDGEGDEDKGSIDGGGDCDAPPVGRGGDPQVVAIVNQAWATRCAVEAGNAAKVTGDVGDCKSPFTVEGTNANAEQLRAMRVSICGHEERAEAAKGENESIVSALEGDLSAMESEFTSIFGEPGGTGNVGIVTSRYGVGGSCPIISVEVPWGGTWTPPAVFCDLLAALRLLFITVATIWALRIIGS